MSKYHWFLIVSLIMVVAAGIICFKNVKNLKRSLYWLVFPDFISIWSKKTWEKDFKNSFRFGVFIALSAILVGLNYLVFRFVL